jgi:hypothetical protein
MSPSPRKQLLRGTLAAAAIAGLVLVFTVLPAEYGIDPTGVGKALGLTSLHAGKAAPAAAPGSTVSAAGETRALTVAARQGPAYRTDVLEVILPPGKGLEVKTHLAKGASLVFSWKTEDGELVNHDFHGEPVNAGKDEFESFIVDKAVSQSSGVLIAPFTGLHGWYWKNTSAVPVRIMLNAGGFYTSIVRL